MKHYQKIVVKIILLWILLFVVGLHPVDGAYTWFNTPDNITSTGDQTRTYNFTISPDSTNKTISWSCDLTDAINEYDEESSWSPRYYHEAYFEITDNSGRIWVSQKKNRITGWTGDDDDEPLYQYSGKFLGKTGVTYTVTLYAGYKESYDSDWGWETNNGQASATLSYYKPYEGNIYKLTRTGRYNLSKIYIPGSLMPGTYSNVNSEYVSSGIRTYKVKVFYDGSISDKSNHTTHWPYISIKECSKEGIIGQELAGIHGYDKSKSGSFELPANKGMYIEMYSGRHENVFGDGRSFTCNLTLQYQYDEAPPNAPGIPEVTINTDGTVLKYDNYRYITNLALIPIQWITAKDNGSSITVKKNIYTTKSGIHEYLIKINDKPEISISGDKTFYNISGLAEGDNKVKIRARDKEPTNNPSGFSPEITIKVDRSAPLPPQMPTAAINGYNSEITWTWPISTDGNGSGIKGYRVYVDAIKNGEIYENISLGKEVISDNSFSHFIQDDTKYVCRVKAVDRVTNESLDSPEGVFIADTSVPNVSLSTYSVRLDGLKAIVKWNAITTDFSGVEQYQLAFTKNTNEPEAIEIVNVSL